MLYRVLQGRLAMERVGNMPWMFFFAALGIPACYVAGLLARTGSNFPSADYWRFIVVHLWVEDFLESFTTTMVAYFFVLLGVVQEAVALRMILLDVILYSVGGIIDTMHHFYFTGAPASNLAFGAFFSALEALPLAFQTAEAWDFIRLGLLQQETSHGFFPHRWAIMFLVAVGFWNFLGAGVLGFIINLPIVSYYEIGTALTTAHAHAAMMGVYGMTAVGFALFCLRYLIPEDLWSERLAKTCFWSMNIGLGWMTFIDLVPVGFAQLYKSVSAGYYEARSLRYLSTEAISLIEWSRLPGDIVFMAGGVVPFVYLCWRGVRHMVPPKPVRGPGDIIFVES